MSCWTGGTPGGAAAEEPPSKRLRPSPEREGPATLQNGVPADRVESADGMADTGSIAMADQVLPEALCHLALPASILIVIAPS